MPIARCVWLPVITKNQVVGLESDISRNKNELLTAENLANPTESLLNVINAYNNEQFGKKHFQKPDYSTQELLKLPEMPFARNSRYCLISKEFEICAKQNFKT